MNVSKPISTSTTGLEPDTAELPETMSTDRRFWFAVVAAIALLSVLRGVRFPNIWTYSHFLFTYEYGFTKRGLLGAAFDALGHPVFRSYDFFAVFASVILVANLVLILRLLKDLIDRGSPMVTGAAVLFSASMALVYFAHTNGYADHIGLLATLVMLRIRGFYGKLIFAAMALPLIILIHEATFLIFFPIMFMSLVFSSRERMWKIQAPLLLVLSIAALGFTFFVTSSTLDGANWWRMFALTQEEAGA